ncbi:hypothetical protein KSZ_69850 [Dictyobacter formicarum]|uniref:Uncharacterized protein n=1 Tax=Dictyobacter formicarum TaxID=2778368 RepID=A0ABQ3VRS9_9CHLR|nr:hypothetical protein KSZ_69850 [Dictyobacter formicarum]
MFIYHNPFVLRVTDKAANFWYKNHRKVRLMQPFKTIKRFHHMDTVVANKKFMRKLNNIA